MNSLLKKFGYSSDWLDSNILSPKFFDLQVRDHSDSGHEGWEHYRYGALVKWLKENDRFTDTQISSVIGIAESDADQPMVKSFVKELICSGKVNQNQVEKLNEFLQAT